MSNDRRAWTIYGCRTAYCIEVAETIWRRGEEVALLVDNLAEPPDGSPRAGVDPPAAVAAPVVRPAQLDPAYRELAAVLPLITPGHRFALQVEARALGLACFPALVDPTAVLARSSTLGEGSVVNAAAVLAGCAEVGRFVHVNRRASVGHHNVIEDFATLGPGCVLAGSVRIGRGAFLGAGAVCAPEVTIGPNSVVGAGAVVIADVAEGSVVVGNPARVLRAEGRGYGEVSVPATPG